MWFLLLLLIFPVVFYIYGMKKFEYWKKKGVTYEEPLHIFGSNLKSVFENVGVTQRFANFYKRYPDEKFVGFFEGYRPALMVRDPELIKHILVNDFRYFHLRGVSPNKECIEPLFHNLFTGDGDVWKLLRQKMTPLFSSGKLKAMFPLIIENAKKLLTVADRYAVSGKEVNIHEMMARYTTDIIGACGFGIESDALDDENSQFRKLGKRILTTTIRDLVISLLKRTAPEAFKRLHFFAPEVERNMMSLVKEVLSQRNNKPSGRNDFIDLMLELRQKGKIIGESIENKNPDGTPAIVELEFTDMLLIAQTFIFFVAAFETSSSASAVALHMLAFHPEAQRRCHEEIDIVLKKYDGKLCYEAVSEMKYLEMVIKEGIRLLPSVGFLLRKSVAPYTFPGTKLTIDADIGIFIPIQAIHLDEKYFEDPEEFIPERFHPDNIHKIERNVFLPFGDGPRACVGERMGLMQAKAGVAMVLSKFETAPSVNSVRKPKIDPNSQIVTVIQGGLPLHLKRRQLYYSDNE